MCFSLALWNEADSILKERLFGLTGSEGNHGEDVKEYYYFLDSTPTHSYMKALYKYPQHAFPYADLVAENRRRGRTEPEYELIDTGIFAKDRYFDVVIEYAKASPRDILIRISATNRSSGPAPLHLLPTLWFRNRWAWNDDTPRPEFRAVERLRLLTTRTNIASFMPDITHWVSIGLLASLPRKWRIIRNCFSLRMRPMRSGCGVCRTVQLSSRMALMMLW